MSDNPPGVPPLQDSSTMFQTPEPISSDGFDLPDINITPQWGIYADDGSPVIVGSSTLSVEFDRDSNVSKYPVEEGGFESYNKVQTPYMVKFSFSQGGTENDRASFLQTLQLIQNNLTLYTGVMPEASYSGITMDHFSFRRTSRNGVTLLQVDTWWQEVRVQGNQDNIQYSFSNETPSISNSNNPESNSPINLGTVQAVSPSQFSSLSTITEAGSSIGAPATITAPGISLTNGIGNIVPSSIASAVRSAVTFISAAKTSAGIISGVINNITTKTPISYNLASGASIPVNEVKNIVPPGFTVVQ